MSEVATKELPGNWVQGQIKDLVTIRNGYAFKSKDFKDEGGVPVIRQTNLSSRIVNFNKPKYLPIEFLDEFESYKINKGDVLIGLSGSIGNLSRYLLDDPALQNQRTGLLVENVPGSIKYVEYYLQLIKEQLLDAAKGVAVQNISSKTIESWNLPIAPSEQQKRIVAKIEKLFSHIDAGIEALKKAKQLLKQYRQSVLKAAVTGELTKEWREVNKADLEPASDVHGSTSAVVAGREGAAQLLERILKERRQKWEEQQLEQFKAKGKMPKDDKWKGKYKEPKTIGADNEMFPREWVRVSLDQILASPLINGLSVKGSDDPPGVAALKLNAISNGTLDFSKRRYLPIHESDVSNLFIKKGDVFISRGNGSLHLVGRAAIADSIEMEAIFPDTMIRARISDQYYIHDLFLLYWNSGYIRSQIESAVKTTAGIWKISQAQLKGITLPLPTLEEQREICSVASEKLSAANRLETEINSQLIKANKNKQSILASAFSGRLKDMGHQFNGTS